MTRYRYLTPYKKNTIQMNKVNNPQNECRHPAPVPVFSAASFIRAAKTGTQAGWLRRNLPKCGTVNAIRPRSEL
jgi:hypothetical protein